MSDLGRQRRKKPTRLELLEALRAVSWRHYDCRCDDCEATRVLLKRETGSWWTTPYPPRPGEEPK